LGQDNDSKNLSPRGYRILLSVTMLILLGSGSVCVSVFVLLVCVLVCVYYFIDHFVRVCLCVCRVRRQAVVHVSAELRSVVCRQQQRSQ
jgi:hypothetical protein